MGVRKNIGLIDCSKAGKAFDLFQSNIQHGYQLSKVLVMGPKSAGLARAHYPTAEIVDTLQSITEDELIDLVIVAGEENAEPGLIPAIMQTGKNLRII